LLAPGPPPVGPPDALLLPDTPPLPPFPPLLAPALPAPPPPGPPPQLPGPPGQGASRNTVDMSRSAAAAADPSARSASSVLASVIADALPAASGGDASSTQLGMTSPPSPAWAAIPGYSTPITTATTAIPRLDR